MMLAFFLQNILDSAIVILVSDDASKPVFSFSDNVDFTPALRPYHKVKIRQQISQSKKKRRSRREANADLILSDYISIKQELGAIDASKSIMYSMENETCKPKHENVRNDFSPRRPTRRESMSLSETWNSELIQSTTVDNKLHCDNKTTYPTTAYYVMPLKSKCKPNSPIAGVA